MYLVIDTWVWKTAQTADSIESVELLARIARKCDYKLIYDYEEEILREYRKHIEQTPIKKIFNNMVQRGKMEPRPAIPKKINCFDKSDLKFIQVALSTPDTIIVSGDSDFLELRKQLEKNKIPLQILTPKEALEIL